MSREQFSFEKGWMQIKNGDIRECREKLMKVMNIKSRAGFCNRLRGDVDHKISEVKAIEGVFAEYGITEVWGKVS